MIRGGNKIIVDGYVYVKQKMLANNITSYECCLRRGSGKELSACKAKVKVEADMEIVDYVNTHSHAPDNSQCEIN